MARFACFFCVHVYQVAKPSSSSLEPCVKYGKNRGRDAHFITGSPESRILGAWCVSTSISTVSSRSLKSYSRYSSHVLRSASPTIFLTCRRGKSRPPRLLVLSAVSFCSNHHRHAQSNTLIQPPQLHSYTDISSCYTSPLRPTFPHCLK